MVPLGPRSRRHASPVVGSPLASADLLTQYEGMMQTSLIALTEAEVGVRVAACCACEATQDHHSRQGPGRAPLEHCVKYFWVGVCVQWTLVIRYTGGCAGRETA